MDPARMCIESLTAAPELENSQGHNPKTQSEQIESALPRMSGHRAEMSRRPLRAGHRQG